MKSEETKRRSWDLLVERVGQSPDKAGWGNSGPKEGGISERRHEGSPKREQLKGKSTFGVLEGPT